MRTLYKKNRRVVIIMSILAAVLCISCQHKKVDFFHGEEPEFRPGPEGGVNQVDVTEGVDFTRYKMVIIDPVMFSFTSAQYNAIPQGALEKLRRDYKQAFTDALVNAYVIVDIPRPDALRLRTLVSGLVPSIPTNPADKEWTYLSTGGASMKAELLDSVTSERLLAVIDTRTGEQLPSVQGRDQWVHTKEAFNFWAGRLRMFLDSIHGRK